MATMRIGIFGGSFDPVHYGHLLLAETCREQAQLDQVWFLPAATPPHKRTLMLAPPRQRIEMLELAIAGHGALRVSTLEIDRGGVSYTVDTLRQIAAENPHDVLFLLMGGDTLDDFPKWREPGAILELATPLVVQRHGAPTPNYPALAGLVSATRLAEIRDLHVDMPVMELSSSDLRERLRAGRSIRYRTPRAVEKYLKENRLYS
jgi:nicotinate-nucleotide adenylyltransferase